MVMYWEYIADKIIYFFVILYLFILLGWFICSTAKAVVRNILEAHTFIPVIILSFW